MNRWLIRSVQIAALSLGGLALTGTAAQADWISGYNAGAFNGNQTSTTVQVPVNICGNSVAIMGFASANCSGGAYASNGNGGSSSGAGSSNWSNGNGNANAHSHKKYKNNGNANSNGKAKSKKAKSNSANSNHHHHSGSGSSNNYYNSNSGSGGGGGAYASNSTGNWTTGYNAGFFNGNQSSTTVQMPINVSCNAVAVAGFAQSC